MSHGNSIGSEANEPFEPTMQGLTEPQNGISIESAHSAQPIPGPSSGSNSSGTASTDLASEDERVHLLKELKSSIESFRGGKVSKMATVADIIRQNSYVSISQSQKEATFDSYLTEILSIQAIFDQSNSRPGTSGIAPNPSSNLGQEGDKEIFKRSKYDAESNFKDDIDESPRKHKLVESDMPWHVPADSTSNISRNPSCQETCQLLRTYNRDISGSKFLVKVAPNCPTSIPSSQ